MCSQPFASHHNGHTSASIQLLTHLVEVPGRPPLGPTAQRLAPTVPCPATRAGLQLTHGCDLRHTHSRSRSSSVKPQYAGSSSGGGLRWSISRGSSLAAKWPSTCGGARPVRSRGGWSHRSQRRRHLSSDPLLPGLRR